MCVSERYKTLAASLVRRRLIQVTDFGGDLVDRAMQAPGAIAHVMASVPSTIKTKADAIATTLSAKLLLHDKLVGDVTDEEFAYQLTQNQNLRCIVGNLTEQILQPTPVTADPEQKSNSFLNLRGGISAFWSEMGQKLPIELETAIEMESILTNVNAGMDASIKPDLRKTFLREAGLSEDRIRELVPISAYVTYENQTKQTLRDQILAEFGFTGELTEEQESLVETVLAERALNDQMMSELSEELLTYENNYGMSAKDLYELFGDPEATMDIHPMPNNDGTNVSTLDAEWEALLHEFGAFDGYQAMLSASFEDTLTMLYASEEGLSLTDGDLKALEEPTVREERTVEALEPAGYSDLDEDEAASYFIPDDELAELFQDGGQQL